MRIIIHIGLSKCGSTTLQNHFAASRDALTAQGVDYPRLPKKLASGANTTISATWCEGGLGLDKVVAASHASTLVLSSEFLSNRSRDIMPETLQAAGAWARDAGHTVEILTIKRPLEAFLKSNYKQMVVNRSTPNRRMAEVNKQGGRWIHANAHQFYVKNLGHGNGQEIDLQEPNWMQHITDYIGVSLPEPAANSNLSPPDVATEMLRQFKGMEPPPSPVHVARLFTLAYGHRSSIISMRAHRHLKEGATALTEMHLDRLAFEPNPPLQYTAEEFNETVETFRALLTANPRAFERNPKEFRAAMAVSGP